MNLFKNTDNINIKTLGGLQQYQDLLQFMGIDPATHATRFFSCHGLRYVTRHIGESHWQRYPLFAVEAGAEKPLARLVVLAGHHGEETAGPMAAAHVVREIMEPGADLAGLLLHVRVAVVACIEPEGYDWDVKRFVGNNRGGYWTRENRCEDINGSWGCRYGARRPPEVVATEAFLRMFLDANAPSYVIDCHETVVSSEDMTIPATIKGTTALGGSGPLLIESCDDRDVGDRMIHQLRSYGREAFPYNRRTRFFEKLSQIPQIEIFAPGRSTIGPFIKEARAVLCTDFVHNEFGANGITIETFLKPLDERVSEHMMLVEGALAHLHEKYVKICKDGMKNTT